MTTVKATARYTANAAKRRGRPAREILATRGSRINARIQERTRRIKISVKIPRKLENKPNKCQPRVIMPRMAKIRSSGKSLNFTNSYYNELAAVVYAGLFGYPLTVKEAKLWAIRKTRAEYSQQKEEAAIKTAGQLKKIPTIAAVFLTGSVAARNARVGADIDLMIITSSHTLWLTRAVVFLLLKNLKLLKSLKNLKRNQICPNIFLDLNHLEIKDRNLFTAHEVLKAKCLYDYGGVYKKWLEDNIWTKKYLPLVYSASLRANAKQSPDVPKQIASSLWFLAMTPLELFAFILQYLYMKPKMTHEKVGWGYAFFHPNNLSEKVLKKFEKELLKYTDK